MIKIKREINFIIKIRTIYQKMQLKIYRNKIISISSEYLNKKKNKKVTKQKKDKEYNQQINHFKE